jgi:hypothetical protein
MQLMTVVSWYLFHEMRSSDDLRPNPACPRFMTVKEHLLFHAVTKMSKQFTKEQMAARIEAVSDRVLGLHFTDHPPTSSPIRPSPRLPASPLFASARPDLFCLFLLLPPPVWGPTWLMHDA